MILMYIQFPNLTSPLFLFNLVIEKEECLGYVLGSGFVNLQCEFFKVFFKEQMVILQPLNTRLVI